MTPTPHAAGIPAFCACTECSAIYLDTEGGAHRGPAITSAVERTRTARSSAYRAALGLPARPTHRTAR